MRSLVLCSALLFLACSSDDTSSDRAPFIPASDVEFIDSLTSHHQMAIEMANEVVARGASSEVKSMAADMITVQTQEIAEMRAARRELTGSEQSEMTMDPHMDLDMGALRAVSGAELDRRFLEEMIVHHAGALQTTHRALPNLAREDMRALAVSANESQAREIGDMRTMLDAMASR